MTRPFLFAVFLALSFVASSASQQVKPAASARACSHCFGEWSWDPATWPDGTTDNYGSCPGMSGDLDDTEPGIDQPGDWLARPADSTHCLTISSEANFPGGLGGNGVRNWFGDGRNNYSGTFQFDFSEVTSTPVEQVWIRFYVRWQSGMQIQDQKLPYFNLSNCGPQATTGGCYMNLRRSEHLLTVGGRTFEGGSWGWTDMMRGSKSDGNWKCYEMRLKAETNDSKNDGEVQLWVDGTQRFLNKKVDFRAPSNPGFSGFQLPGNVSAVTVVGGNGREDAPEKSPANWIDIDDVAASSSQRVGCF